MPTMSDADLLAYMRGYRLAVVATLGSDGGPQSALVGIAVTDVFEIVFDTVASSRKHANLLRDPRVAVAFGGPDERNEKTLQYEGVAALVSPTDAAGAPWREAYYSVWPDGRARLAWPDIAYWRIVPRWLRFSDFGRGPLIVERRFEAQP